MEYHDTTGPYACVTPGMSAGYDSQPIEREAMGRDLVQPRELETLYVCIQPRAAFKEV